MKKIVMFLIINILFCCSSSRANEFNLANNYTHEALNFTNDLDNYGDKLGNLIFDYIENKDVRIEEIILLQKNQEKEIISKIEYFKKKNSPDFTEFNAFKSNFIEYLIWQNKILNSMSKQIIYEVNKPNLSNNEKIQSVMKIVKTNDENEKVWKAKLEKSVDDLYMYMNTNN